MPGCFRPFVVVELCPIDLRADHPYGTFCCGQPVDAPGAGPDLVHLDEPPDVHEQGPEHSIPA